MEIFGGSLLSQVKCMMCGAESNKVDEILDISLNILRSGSLKDALHKFFEPEVLDGNNKYNCEKCKKLVPAEKQMSLFQAPNVLVIQLKRFEGIYGGKIDKAISFEELLVLSNFLRRGSLDSAPDYHLFGTIVHTGFSPDSGHYYAYVKDAMGKWYCCNDSHVSVTTLEEVLSEKVYVLFYARTKQRPSSSPSIPAANGVKSHALIGTGASKKQPSCPPSRSAHGRAVVESTCKGPSALTIDRLTSSPCVKFSISGNIASKRVPAVTSGKMLLHENQLFDKTSDFKQPIQMKKNGKNPSTNVNTNCFDKGNEVPLNVSQRNEDVEHERYNPNKNRVNTLDGAKTTLTPFRNGNGKAGSVSLMSAKSDIHEINGIDGKSSSKRSVPNSHESRNGGANHHRDMPSFGRKMLDRSCILLAQDAESRAKVEELKEVLKNEASTMLRSCGWSDEVYSFMRAKRRKCTDNVGKDPLHINHLRNLLIAEAKPSFISSIPESLKKNLISQLRSINKKKG